MLISTYLRFNIHQHSLEILGVNKDIDLGMCGVAVFKKILDVDI
jgi:hypothetical protein